MSDLKSVVFCSLQFEGFHNWPGCPFEEVKYLRDRHRHIFHVKAFKRVTHSDRDVEFIMMKNAISAFIRDLYPRGEMGATSCEMLAEILINKFELCQCEVNEDGENGAIVFNPKAN